MRSASRFISTAKASSVPDTASASATAASLPDWTIRPYSRSLIDTGVDGSMNILELSPETFQARTDTLTIWSIANFFSWMAWNTR